MHLQLSFYNRFSLHRRNKGEQILQFLFFLFNFANIVLFLQMYLHARLVPYIVVYVYIHTHVCMHLFIKLEIQGSQDAHRKLEHASLLCKVVILAMTDEEELVTPLRFTQCLGTVRDNETLQQIPCDTNFSSSMLEDGQQQY